MDLNNMKVVALEKGLTPEEINAVADKIESDEIELIEKYGWMRCLIPNQFIPGDVFVRFSCLLSNSSFSILLKIEILKWMITVHPFMKSSCFDMFRSLYEIYLVLLSDKKLRPYICDLLYLITDELDVTERRVNYIREIIKEMDEEEPCLTLLLVTYYRLNPAVFNEEVDEDFQYTFQDLGYYPELMKYVHSQYKIKKPKIHISTRKRNVRSGLNRQANFDHEELCSKSPKKSLFHDIFHEFEVLEKSNVSEIMASKYRRLFLTSDSSLKSKIKIYDYIVTSLNQKSYSPEFLEELLKMFHEIQRSWRGITDFILNPGITWDSSTLKFCAALLPYEQLCCFKCLLAKMNVIHLEFLKADAPVKCWMLNCFSKLYENWAFEYKNSETAPCYGMCSNSDDRSDQSISLVPAEEINKLHSYIDSICNGLLLDDIQPCMINQILLHYERVSLSRMKTDGLAIHFPVYTVFHAALFSLSYLSLDNLGKLMILYHKEAKRIKSKKVPESSHVLRTFKRLANDVNMLKGVKSRNNLTFFSDKDFMINFKRMYPHFYKQLSLRKHTATLVKKHQYNHLVKPVSDEEYATYLDENGLKYLIEFFEMIR